MTRRPARSLAFTSELSVGIEIDDDGLGEQHSGRRHQEVDQGRKAGELRLSRVAPSMNASPTPPSRNTPSTKADPTTSPDRLKTAWVSTPDETITFGMM